MYLAVHFDTISKNWVVINTFDGVIVDRFEDWGSAVAYANEYEAIEAQRIENEYPIA